MSETVPLCPTLGVQFVFVIECNILSQSLDLVFENFSAESRNFWMVQW